MNEQLLLDEIKELRAQVGKLQADILLMKYAIETQLDLIASKIPDTAVEIADPMAGDPMMRFANPRIEKL